MGIIALFIVFWALVSNICDSINNSPKNKMKALDNNPYCTIKTNKWHREHDNK